MFYQPTIPLALTFLSISSIQSYSAFALPQGGGSSKPANKPDPRSGKYYALGDSFASGTGAGNDISPGFPQCKRTDGSYPWQTQQRFFGGTATTPGNFQFNACNGQNIQLVMQYQIPTTGTDASLVTIQAGGNNAGFAPILQNCIYAGTEGSTGCQNALGAADSGIADPQLATDLNNMYAALNTQVPNANIFAFGYPSFFNVDVPSTTISPACATTQGLRQRINGQVQALNNVIRTAAGNNNIVYLDVDPSFDGHRFCDNGVQFLNSVSTDFPSGLFHPSQAGHAAYADQITQALAAIPN